MPTRRALLVASATGAAALGAGAWLSVGDPADDTKVLDVSATPESRWDAVKRHLREHFHYLTLPEATLDAFVVAAKQHGRLPARAGALAALRRQFLMSTDFLLKEADESRPVGFVAWYDPYLTPCWNPLMRAASPDAGSEAAASGELATEEGG